MEIKSTFIAFGSVKDSGEPFLTCFQDQGKSYISILHPFCIFRTSSFNEIHWAAAHRCSDPLER